MADTAEGPSFMLAGPDGLYVGGNFFDTASTPAKVNPASGQKMATLTINNPTYHPGFAIFPPQK